MEIYIEFYLRFWSRSRDFLEKRRRPIFDHQNQKISSESLFFYITDISDIYIIKPWKIKKNNENPWKSWKNMKNIEKSWKNKKKQIFDFFHHRPKKSISETKFNLEKKIRKMSVHQVPSIAVKFFFESTAASETIFFYFFYFFLFFVCVCLLKV